jgi:hypothetical protein
MAKLGRTPKHVRIGRGFTEKNNCYRLRRLKIAESKVTWQKRN